MLVPWLNPLNGITVQLKYYQVHYCGLLDPALLLLPPTPRPLLSSSPGAPAAPAPFCSGTWQTCSVLPLSSAWLAFRAHTCQADGRCAERLRLVPRDRIDTSVSQPLMSCFPRHLLLSVQLLSTPVIVRLTKTSLSTRLPQAVRGTGSLLHTGLTHVQANGAIVSWNVSDCHRREREQGREHWQKVFHLEGTHVTSTDF